MSFDENSFLTGIVVGSAVRPGRLKGCLLFLSGSPFTISSPSPGWDGTLEYSSDRRTWQTWSGESISPSGGRLYVRGTGNTILTGSYAGRWRYTGTGIRCIGNVEDLLDYRTVAAGRHPTMADYCMERLFEGCTALTEAPELPATTLSRGCYEFMFYGCTSLTKAPKLPARKMAFQCYYSMFRSCTALTEAPELPATTLAEACYQYMFYGCTSLTAPPALRNAALATTCYASMFSNCTALAALPLLPAAQLPAICYSGMFSGCSSIKLSETQTEEYATPYRLPPEGTGAAGTNAVKDMFKDTGGTFTGTPTINTTYYTSNEVIT